MNLEAIVNRLKRLQVEIAEEAMEHPGEGDPFSYGRRVGTYNGVGMAWEAIAALYRDDEEQDDKL